MRIEIRQQGGFAGLRPPPLVVDTGELDPAAASELERLAGELPPSGEPGRGADLMRYDISIDDGRSGTYYEPGVPDQVRRLLRLARDADRA